MMLKNERGESPAVTPTLTSNSFHGISEVKY